MQITITLPHHCKEADDQHTTWTVHADAHPVGQPEAAYRETLSIEGVEPPLSRRTHAALYVLVLRQLADRIEEEIDNGSVTDESDDGEETNGQTDL